MIIQLRDATVSKTSKGTSRNYVILLDPPRGGSFSIAIKCNIKFYISYTQADMQAKLQRQLPHQSINRNATNHFMEPPPPRHPLHTVTIHRRLEAQARMIAMNFDYTQHPYTKLKSLAAGAPIQGHTDQVHRQRRRGGCTLCRQERSCGSRQSNLAGPSLVHIPSVYIACRSNIPLYSRPPTASHTSKTSPLAAATRTRYLILGTPNLDPIDEFSLRVCRV